MCHLDLTGLRKLKPRRVSKMSSEGAGPAVATPPLDPTQAQLDKAEALKLEGNAFFKAGEQGKALRKHHEVGGGRSSDDGGGAVCLRRAGQTGEWHGVLRGTCWDQRSRRSHGPSSGPEPLNVSAFAAQHRAPLCFAIH